MPDAVDTEGAGSRASALVAAGILLSRLSGLVREKLLGYFLGAGLGVEAFRVALRIPNLLQNLLGEGVLSASFIPVYSRLVDEGREDEASRVAGAIAGLLMAVTGVLVVVGVVFAGPITALIAFGIPRDSDKFELTVRLVRILTPGVAFLVLSAWCLGILNSHRRFFLSYVAPVLWNGAMVAALVAGGVAGLADQPLAVALAWGAVAGGLLQFLVQLPTVRTLAPGLRPSLDRSLPGVKRTIRALGPIVAGRGVVQLSAYVDIFIASFLATGAIAALGFAQVLYVLPISLFGMSVAAAELPELSTMDHADRRSVRRRLERGAARIATFVVPTAVAYVTIGDMVVGLLYQGGEFGSLTTRQVWFVLGAYAFGLIASTQSRLLQSALYGVGDTRRPAQYAVVRVTVSAVLGVLLMLQFDRITVLATGLAVGDLPSFTLPDPDLRAAPENLHRLGAVGLALGASVGAWVEFALLDRAVRRRFGMVRIGGGRLGHVLAASAAVLVATIATRPFVGGLHPWFGGPIAIAVGATTYLVAAHRLGLDEVTDVLDALRRRVRRR